MNAIVRPALPDDAEALVALCAEHAAYERAAYVTAGKAAALAEQLAAPVPRVKLWLATRDGAAVGYAAASLEFSTWAAREFVHLDCIYLRAAARNGGIGRALFAAVVDFARDRAAAEVQWQTPAWNVDAQRWYRRLGAVGAEKLRYSLRLA